MKRYFIIGTDTDIGKTYVTCQLLDYLKARGKRVYAIKPVASGCSEQDNQLFSGDELLLQQHNGAMDFPICRWRFKPPISPHIAAREASVSLTKEAIVQFCEESVPDEMDYQLIETAGGLMSPLNDQESWLDVLVYSQIPVIFVVGVRLGCLNHAFLTELALTSHHIRCVGWIANCVDANMLALPEVIDTLRCRLNSPLLATIAYGKGIEGASLLEDFESI